MHPKHHGFTLLESMIVMAILAIVLSLAVPSMVDIRNRSQVDAVQRDLISAMNAGRALAITQGQPISLCASSDGVHCDGVWQQWILVSGALPAASSAASVLRNASFMGVDVAANATGVTWQSTGEVNHSLTLSLCPPDQADQRQVSLSLIGRPRGSLDLDRDGVHNLPTGSCP